MPTDHDIWKWQEPGSAWKGVGIYHVTLTVPSREALLGELVVPENDPKQAWVERLEMGKKVIHSLAQITVRHPEIQLLQYCLMPDHLHAILYVSKPLTIGIRAVIRGFWQGVKKIGREQVLSIDPDIIRDNKQNLPVGENPIFTERPFIRPLSRHGQLDTMYHYIRMNPQRLATKRLMPNLFWVQDNINIAGRIYKGVGNAELLQRAQYMPVHVRSTMVEEAQHGDNKRLRDYMNGCVLAARKGTVMVSPFISQYEQAVMAVLLKEQLPFIYIADNGFRDYYKPQDSLFDAVAEKRVLILSPFEYDPQMKRVSRARCVEMNGIAEEICTLSISSESN